MRAIGTIIVAVALVGCSSARSGAGKYADAADRNAAAAAPEPEPEKKRPPLPGGLGGDTEHRAYTTPPS